MGIACEICRGPTAYYYNDYYVSTQGAVQMYSVRGVCPCAGVFSFQVNVQDKTAVKDSTGLSHACESGRVACGMKLS